MSAVVDTSVLVDVLRATPGARESLEDHRAEGKLHASEITRAEVLIGMRPIEETETQALLSVLIWHPVDTVVAEQAGALGRAWRPSHQGIDAADVVIAATSQLLGLPLLTRNVRHFPMFPDLAPPY